MPLIFSSVNGQGSVESNAYDSYVLCKYDKMVRTIRVEKNKETNSWVTYYTKLGVDKEVARGQAIESCHKVVENIRENLTKANWKCKDLQKVSSTKTSEETPK